MNLPAKLSFLRNKEAASVPQSPFLGCAVLVDCLNAPSGQHLPGGVAGDLVSGSLALELNTHLVPYQGLPKAFKVLATSWSSGLINTILSLQGICVMLCRMSRKRRSLSPTLGQNVRTEAQR